MTPFFSVIVPVYNGARWLGQCVDSILAQTYTDFELILVDDGSADGSGDICGQYAAKDGRVQALRQPNAGPTPARRNALARARGEYVCFADADDWVVPNWLETIKGYIDENRRPDMVLFDFFQVDGDEDLPDIFPPAGYYDKARLTAEIYPYMLCDRRKIPNDPRRQSFGSRQLFGGYLWSKAFRRQLIAEHFISDDRITIFEDVAMAYECMYYASDAYIAHDKLYAYRYLPSSNLRHYRPRYLEEIDALFDYLTEHLGRLDPVFGPQINAFCARRVVLFTAGELRQHDMRTGQAARALSEAMARTRLVRKLSLGGLDLPLTVFLLLLKCRLTYMAAALTRRRM